MKAAKLEDKIATRKVGHGDVMSYYHAAKKAGVSILDAKSFVKRNRKK